MSKKGRGEVLVKAIQILRFIASHRFGVTVMQIVEEVGVVKRSVYRYMNAFRAAGIRIHPVPGQAKNQTKFFRLMTPREHLERIGII